MYSEGTGGGRMKILSASKLSETVNTLRIRKKMTQTKLGKLTGLNRITIGRIERGEFIPSIGQLETLANTLEFDITDMFVEKKQSQSFIALRSEALSDIEREGVDTLLNMMFVLRQQILLRKKLKYESKI